MAVAIGISAGFCASTPTADPTGSPYTVDGQQIATVDTSPSGSNEVTELGFYQSQFNNDAAEYSCGLYSHDAVNDRPNALISSQSTGQSTTASTQGWYAYTGLSISLTASTTYWVAVGMEAVSAANNLDFSGTGKFRQNNHVESSPSFLSDPFGSPESSFSVIASIFAKYEAVGAAGNPWYYYAQQ